ncbi:AraC family transcriptional regulator [Paraburkholderia sp. MMS20-SJTR3]|uniref:AraC family transcriptional regulator n=1 Tax=Paraburkholderia sejongensis TaxID=2886946 RepID=A0ABS8K4D5_9BURK|nr:AraC family transcriptional regulator [Paraburkholderia sp. MMS20-SJTR3]MCC8397028.1 AraC family transcriptional regulator [Paraburkholderia sp. MMS20-SJTR3]
MEISIPRKHSNRLGATRAREDVQREVAKLLCEHRMEVAGHEPLHAELYGVPLHRASLLELCYGRATRIDAGELDDHFLFRSTLAGHCELQSGSQRVSLSAGSLSVSSPSRASRISTDTDCRSLLLRVDRAALELRLADMLQSSLRQPLVFDLEVGRAHSGAAAFHSTLRYLCNLCEQIDASARDSLLGPELTQWLVTLLLLQLPHSYSDALARGAKPPLPTHVKRARDYIDAHLGEPLSVATLAQAAGVSPRTLQNGFSQFLDVSPAEYIRERRIEAVHRVLQQNPQRSVTDVLLEHGVHSFGHFAKAYARRYGQPPSATAKRGASSLRASS